MTFMSTPPTSSGSSPPPPAYHINPEPPAYTTVLSRTLSRPYHVASASPQLPSGTNSATPQIKRRSSIASTFKKSSTPAGPDLDLEPVVDPKTLLPPTFRVGTKYTRPVVDIQGMKDHLVLLAAIEKNMHSVIKSALEGTYGDASHNVGTSDEKAGFRPNGDIKQEKPELEGEPQSQPILTPDVAWMAYATKSERAFQEWIQSDIVQNTQSKKEWTGEQLPRDLGVIMIWHAYCLNPRCELRGSSARSTGLQVRGF